MKINILINNYVISILKTNSLLETFIIFFRNIKEIRIKSLIVLCLIKVFNINNDLYIVK